MSRTDAPPAPTETEPETIVRPATRRRAKSNAKRQPPYGVVLHNDDINGMEHVVGALRKVFNYDLMKAVGLMLQAHQTGRSIVWTGTLELAELKADQLRSCGPDPNTRDRGACQLGVTVEPLPSE
jgi:ATP-dependent Clp protease adaptor protein ClpS